MEWVAVNYCTSHTNTVKIDSTGGIKDQNAFLQSKRQGALVERGLWITARERRIPTSRNLNQNSAVLWQIFSSNKRTPAKRKKGFNTNSDPRKQEVGFIFV
jgi:hypothetical protein